MTWTLPREVSPHDQWGREGDSAWEEEEELERDLEYGRIPDDEEDPDD